MICAHSCESEITVSVVMTISFLQYILLPSIIYHCKNTWVTLTTFLGCLGYISVTKKKCYQISFLESSLKRFFFSYITLAILFLQNTYLATFLAFLLQTVQPRNSPEADVQDQRNNKPHQKCLFIGFLK